MSIKNESSNPSPKKNYFWDYTKKLSLQCILDQTLWINNCEIHGTQSLGKKIQIVKIKSDRIIIKTQNNLFKLFVGQRFNSQ